MKQAVKSARIAGAGIREISKGVAAHLLFQEKRLRAASAGRRRSSNRFHNLEEHGYDYDEMVWSMINGAQKTGGDDGTQ